MTALQYLRACWRLAYLQAVYEFAHSIRAFLMRALICFSFFDFMICSVELAVLRGMIRGKGNRRRDTFSEKLLRDFSGKSCMTGRFTT